MDLTSLLALLRANGVQKFKGMDFEIEFEAAKIADPAPAEHAPEPAPTATPQYPPGMPEDLKNPEAMSFDKVLNWSGSPDPSDDVAPLPLTGDQVLDPPAVQGGEP